MKSRLIAITALSLLLTAPHLSAQQPSLNTVLDRATAYVADFKRQLSGIVAEEAYVQDIRRPIAIRGEVTHRELKSDLLLVRVADADRYVEFRDVFEVDGQPVRDREERLSKLFLDPAASAGQLQQIIAESARYNLGTTGSTRVRRNTNIPTLAMLFLDPDYRSRFTFSRVTDRTGRVPMLAQRPGDSANSFFTMPSDAWVISYREKERHTIVQTPDGQDVPASGRMWIEPLTGRLLATELTLGGGGSLRTVIDVSYRTEPSLGFFVPAQMREMYGNVNLSISGTATYLNFRRFNVEVKESVGPIVR